MRKTLLLMTVAIISGGIIGIALFSEYKETSSVFSDKKKLYFLEEGIYSSKKLLEYNTKNIDPKLIVEKDGKYHLYVGITGEQKNISKIKNIYKNKGYSIYEKELEIDNLEFLSNIEQFDILLDNANNESDISAIEEVVLSNYENLVM